MRGTGWKLPTAVTGALVLLLVPSWCESRDRSERIDKLDEQLAEEHRWDAAYGVEGGIYTGGECDHYRLGAVRQNPDTGRKFRCVQVTDGDYANKEWQLIE